MHMSDTHSEATEPVLLKRLTRVCSHLRLHTSLRLPRTAYRHEARVENRVDRRMERRSERWNY